VEIFNGFLNGTKKDSGSKNLLLVAIILIIVFGFIKNRGANLFANNERTDKHHRYRKSSNK
jgi:hypothetical protein